MEEFRRNRLNELIVIIQTKFRSYFQRKQFIRLKQSQILIARTWRERRVSILHLCTYNVTLLLHLHCYGSSPPVYFSICI